jgi:hypothetical protein
MAAVILSMAACTARPDESERPVIQPPTAAGLPADATVTYAFRDSSVPPPYHRSFVITVDRNTARIVVDSYGTVLADRTAPTPPGVWEQLRNTIGELDGIVIEEPEQGCTGGTGFALSVSEGGPTLEGSACGGANSNAEERVAAWIAPARSLFPPMGQLAPDGPG